MQRGILFMGQMYEVGDIIALAPEYPPERLANGQLTECDRLAVVGYSKQHDAIVIEPISYTLASLFAPEKVTKALTATRGAHY